MKKILLKERELVLLIKSIISEIDNKNQYKTMYRHVLRNKINNKEYVINKDDLWVKKIKNSEVYYEHQNSTPKLYFTCSGKLLSAYEEEDTYTPRNINQFEGSKSLSSTMKAKLCQ